MHCYIDARAKAKGTDELSPEESINLLHELAKVNSEAVLILTGGEPLLRPDIFNLIRKSISLGFWTVLGSHGGLLDERIANELAEAGLKGIGVSLDSLNPEKHDQFRGIPKSFEKTTKAIGVIQEKKIPFLIEMTVTKQNSGELAEMAHFALEKKASALNVFFLVPTGRGAGLTDLTPLQYEETLQELAKLQEKYAGRLLINAKCAPHYRRVLYELFPTSPFVRTFQGGGCPAGTYYCRITPEGDVTPCPYMPLPVGNVRKDSFQEIWMGAPIFQRLREANLGGRCGQCEFHELCGGCRCRAYAVTGDYLAEDPSCTYVPGKYKGKSIPVAPEHLYGISETGTLTWSTDALERLKKIPFFARGMVKRALESKANSDGITLITEEYMVETRAKMSERFPVNL